jgi:hypothetical protein
MGDERGGGRSRRAVALGEHGRECRARGGGIKPANGLLGGTASGGRRPGAAVRGADILSAR